MLSFMVVLAIRKAWRCGGFYNVEDAREFLTAAGIDADTIAPRSKMSSSPSCVPASLGEPLLAAIRPAVSLELDLGAGSVSLGVLCTPLPGESAPTRCDRIDLLKSKKAEQLRQGEIFVPRHSHLGLSGLHRDRAACKRMRSVNSSVTARIHRWPSTEMLAAPKGR